MYHISITVAIDTDDPAAAEAIRANLEESLDLVDPQHEGIDGLESLELIASAVTFQGDTTTADDTTELTHEQQATVESLADEHGTVRVSRPRHGGSVYIVPTDEDGRDIACLGRWYDRQGSDVR